MEKMYMVRGGKEASYYDEFHSKKIIGIGWNELGDLTGIKDISEIKSLMEKYYPNAKSRAMGYNIGQIRRFLLDMKIGDYVS
jgi:restriction system protein